MKLVTRILSFEWLAVSVMACVCALSIKLLSENADKISEFVDQQRQQSQTTQALRNAHQSYAIIESRIRLGEARPQELIQAKTSIAAALRNIPKSSTNNSPTLGFDDLRQESRSYLAKQSTLEKVLSKIDKIESIQNAVFAEELRQAQAPNDAGITLLALIGGLAILVTLLLAARSSKTIGQPLETLHRTVLDLTKAENAHRRVPDGNYDPSLRELGKAINQLAQRLERAEGGSQQDKGLMNASAQALIERLPDALIIVDLSGRTRMSNEKARALLQTYSPSALRLPEMTLAGLENKVGNTTEEVFVLKSWSNTSIGFVFRLHPPKSD